MRGIKNNKQQHVYKFNTFFVFYIFHMTSNLQQPVSRGMKILPTVSKQLPEVFFSCVKWWCIQIQTNSVCVCEEPVSPLDESISFLNGACARESIELWVICSLNIVKLVKFFIIILKCVKVSELHTSIQM